MVKIISNSKQYCYIMSLNDGRRGRREETRLTQGEKGYLESGDPGTYRESRLEDNITKKADRVPDRFECLFEDIELLRENGYFTGEVWGETWIDLFGLDALTGERWQDSVHVAVERFGMRLGEMARRLMIIPRGMDQQGLFTDLVMGFVQGVFPQNNPNNLERLANDIEYKAEQVRAEQKRAANTFYSFKETASDHFEQINELLKNNGIAEPKGYHARIVGEHCKEHGIGQVTEQVVMDVIETERLIERQKLDEICRATVEKIEAAEWDGVDVTDVLRSAHDSNNGHESVTTDDIAGRVDEPHNRVNKIGKYLAGKDGEVGEQLDAPIVELDRTGGFNHWQWSLTAYGQVVQNHLCHDNIEIVQAARSATENPPSPTIDSPDSLVHKVLDELDLADD